MKKTYKVVVVMLYKDAVEREHMRVYDEYLGRGCDHIVGVYTDRQGAERCIERLCNEALAKHKLEFTKKDFAVLTQKIKGDIAGAVWSRMQEHYGLLP